MPALLLFILHTERETHTPTHPHTHTPTHTPLLPRPCGEVPGPLPASPVGPVQYEHHWGTNHYIWGVSLPLDWFCSDQQRT